MSRSVVAILLAEIVFPGPALAQGVSAGLTAALVFGNGGTGGDTGKLYFTAGTEDEQHGLFGQIRERHPGEDDDDDNEGEDRNHNGRN